MAEKTTLPVVIVNYDLSYLDEAAQELSLAFSGYPWKENWSLEQAKARIEELTTGRGKVGFLLVDSTKKVYGMALGRLLTFPQGTEFILDEFSVLPSHQHQHLGTRLMTHLLAALKEKKVARFSLVTRDHYPCLDFYQSCGLSLSSIERVLEKDL
ncbi:MAG: GNAT family N-acetyltransferase [Bacilli bacterium]|jgi:ribosomal protein S18 acetylase RimI-like enzyme|nr:GNAT family N-acetyltransferase [Bacilli bacterium]